MSSEEENAVAGKIIAHHNEARRRLIYLTTEAKELAAKLSELAALLEKGPPYPKLPLTGFLDAIKTQKLFKDLHDTYEEEVTTSEKLKQLE